MIVNGQKLTAATKLEDELSLKLSSLMENSTDWIFFKDLNSIFTLASLSLVEQLTGEQDASKVIGKTDADFMDPNFAQKIYDDDQAVMESGEAIDGKMEMLLFDDGSQKWLSTSKMPLKDLQGNIVGLMGIARDITSEKLVEKELEKKNSELVAASRRAGMAEVATNVIHNVGNVLNSINVSTSRVHDISKKLDFENLTKLSEMLEANIDSEEFFAEGGKGRLIPDYLSKLVTSMESHTNLLQEEIEASRRHLEHVRSIISRQQQYATNFSVLERVDLSELVEDALRMSSASLANHRINLVRDFEPGMIIEIDKHRVLQIVVNLIRNAKHACMDSGKSIREIRLSVAPAGENGCEIRIRDNGVGIAEENLVKIFNHGFTTRPDGHGFGLHSGANSAKQMNGSIVVHSDGLGCGAEFVLTLPDARVIADV